MHKINTVLTLCSVLIIAACSDSSNNNPVREPLPERYQLSSTSSVPEGVAFDPQARAFYATSLQGGSIVRFDSAGNESTFRAADNRARLVGAKIDASKRRLWVCAQQVDAIDNRVWVFNLNTGVLEMEFLLGALSTNGSCNDLVLDSTGAAYVTDPANPNIYRLDPVSGTGDILIADPQLADVTGAALGLNGIALTPDERALIVGKFVPAALLRVTLVGAVSVEPIALSGDTLPSPDGLVMLQGDLYAVADESVSRVQFNSDFSSASVVTVPQPSGLSTAASAEEQLYVIKSDVLNFVLNRPLSTPFEIFRIDLDAFSR